MIREFWKEVREEEKEKKRLKKEAKKKHLTGEQKAYKVFGILLTIFVIFGSIFFTCKSSGDGDGDYNFSWGELAGISEEMIEELNNPVDLNLLIPNGKINSGDAIDFEKKMSDAGVNEEIFGDDLDDMEEDVFYIDREMTLTSKELGAYCNSMAKELGESGLLEVLDLKVSYDNGYYLTTIAHCDLAEIVGYDELPKVYLTTVSEIRLMGSDKTLKTVGGSIHINRLDEDKNDEIVETIDSVNTLSTYVNALVVDYIELLKEIVNAELKLMDDGIKFIPLH